jgi:hypothetical protein
MECLPPLRAVDEPVACSSRSSGVFSASPSGCVANQQIVVRPGSLATLAAIQTPIRTLRAKRFKVSAFHISPAVTQCSAFSCGLAAVYGSGG